MHSIDNSGLMIGESNNKADSAQEALDAAVSVSDEGVHELYLTLLFSGIGYLDASEDLGLCRGQALKYRGLTVIGAQREPGLTRVRVIFSSRWQSDFGVKRLGSVIYGFGEGVKRALKMPRETAFKVYFWGQK